MSEQSECVRTVQDMSGQFKICPHSSKYVWKAQIAQNVSRDFPICEQFFMIPKQIQIVLSPNAPISPKVPLVQMS